MRFIAKIQSVSDLITNSSSELFVVTSQSMPAVALAELLQAIGSRDYFSGDWESWNSLSEEEKKMYDSSSGMGREFSIMTMYENAKKYIPDNKKHLFTKEIYSLHFSNSVEELETFLWIDHNRCATIN